MPLAADPLCESFVIAKTVLEQTALDLLADASRATSLPVNVVAFEPCCGGTGRTKWPSSLTDSDLSLIDFCEKYTGDTVTLREKPGSQSGNSGPFTRGSHAREGDKPGW
jgi:hypothetical protein